MPKPTSSNVRDSFSLPTPRAPTETTGPHLTIAWKHYKQTNPTDNIESFLKAIEEELQKKLRPRCNDTTPLLHKILTEYSYRNPEPTIDFWNLIREELMNCDVTLRIPDLKKAPWLNRLWHTKLNHQINFNFPSASFIRLPTEYTPKKMFEYTIDAYNEHLHPTSNAPKIQHLRELFAAFNSEINPDNRMSYEEVDQRFWKTIAAELTSCGMLVKTEEASVTSVARSGSQLSTFSVTLCPRPQADSASKTPTYPKMTRV